MVFLVYLFSALLIFTATPVLAQEADHHPAQALYDQAFLDHENGHLSKTVDHLGKIISAYPDFPQIEHVKEEWQRILWNMIHTDITSPGSLVYQVKAGDTLDKIARKHGTTIELIKSRNHLSNDKLKLGQKLSLWVKPFVIVVNKSANLLSLNFERKIVKVYRVSTGKSETTTPLGEFTIQSRYPNPTWFHHGDIVAPGSPENYLGTRWLGFNKPKYGIHGTIYPELIGQSVSGGCIRMKNADVEELYDIIPIGTKVLIVEK
jgi:LysM repeat protein